MAEVGGGGGDLVGGGLRAESALPMAAEKIFNSIQHFFFTLGYTVVGRCMVVPFLCSSQQRLELVGKKKVEKGRRDWNRLSGGVGRFGVLKVGGGRTWHGRMGKGRDRTGGTWEGEWGEGFYTLVVLQCFLVIAERPDLTGGIFLFLCSSISQRPKSYFKNNYYKLMRVIFLVQNSVKIRL